MSYISCSETRERTWKSLRTGGALQPRADCKLLLLIFAKFFNIPHSPKANSKETSLGQSFRGGNQPSKVEFTFLHGSCISDLWAHCLPSCPSRRNKNTNSRPQDFNQGFTWTRTALRAGAGSSLRPHLQSAADHKNNIQLTQV